MPKKTKSSLIPSSHKNKRASKQPSKLTTLSNLLNKNKKKALRIASIVIVLVAIGGAIPFPHTFAKTVSTPFATDTQQSAELELDDSKVVQEGINGSKSLQMSSWQSMWGRLFGLQPIQPKELKSIVLKSPTNKIVVEGTRKYQYMLCSDGSYRYYTDEQFKEPTTGFTSKSSDYCKENNQGYKLSLADRSTATNTPVNNSARSSQPDTYEADKINREVTKLNWCIQEEKKIGDEYIGKVHQAQATQGITNKEFNAIVDPAYFKYSGNIGLLRASGCTVTSPYPNYIRQ